MRLPTYLMECKEFLYTNPLYFNITSSRLECVNVCFHIENKRIYFNAELNLVVEIEFEFEKRFDEKERGGVKFQRLLRKIFHTAYVLYLTYHSFTNTIHCSLMFHS